jgi:hypothetical protein
MRNYRDETLHREGGTQELGNVAIVLNHQNGVHNGPPFLGQTLPGVYSQGLNTV